MKHTSIAVFAGGVVVAAAVFLWINPEGQKTELTGERPGLAQAGEAPAISPPETAVPAPERPDASGAPSEAEDALVAIRDLARKDPRAALAKLAALADTDSREEFCKALAIGWAHADPIGCARWVDSLADAQSKKGAALGLTSVWSGRDGPAALAWVRTLPEGTTRESALMETAIGWTNAKPIEALEAFLGLPAEPALAQAMDELLWRAITRAPNETLARLDQLAPARREELLEVALMAAAIDHPENAWALSARMRDAEGAMRVRLISIRGITEADPAKARALFVEAGSPIELVNAIATVWFEKDPDAVMRWMETLPSEVHKLEARRAVLAESAEFGAAHRSGPTPQAPVPAPVAAPYESNEMATGQRKKE